MSEVTSQAILQSILADQANPNSMERLLAQNDIDVELEAVTAQPIGTGQMAHNLRLFLTPKNRAVHCPESVVLKMPSPDERSRRSGNGPSGFYTREVNFYKRFSTSARARIPRCFFAEQNESGFAIVLEDLAPARQGDQIAGVSLEQAEQAIAEAAKLHASHWCDDSINALPWVTGTKAAPVWKDPGSAMAHMWSKFCDRYEDRISASAMDVGDQFIPNFDQYWIGREGPKCLIHNDFRPDNMMFGTTEGGYPVAIVDWQTLGFGCGTSDVSYFLAGALKPDLRQKNLNALLNKYHQSLIDYGISNYSFDQLFEDFRFHSFKLFYSALVGAMVTVQTERGDDMFFVMLDGATQQIRDMNALELLG